MTHTNTTTGRKGFSEAQRTAITTGNRSVATLGRRVTCSVPAEPNVEVRVTHQLDGTCVVACSGELDIAADLHFECALDEVLRRRVRRLVIDLCRVAFIDSAAIGQILRAYRSVEAQFEIVTANPHTRMLLQIAGLGDVTRMWRNAIPHATPA